MPSPWFTGLLCLSFCKMAASENDAAQSTKIIGSTSDELNNGTQSPNYELEETARMERILKDTQALARQKISKFH